MLPVSDLANQVSYDPSLFLIPQLPSRNLKPPAASIALTLAPTSLDVRLTSSWPSALTVVSPRSISPLPAIDILGVPDVLSASVSKSIVSGSYAFAAALYDITNVPDPAA